MSAVMAAIAVLLCDWLDPDGRRCPAYVVPLVYQDPTSGASVLAGKREAYAAGTAAGWCTVATDLCPTHAAEARRAEAGEAE
jgi:hypothetical protein